MPHPTAAITHPQPPPAPPRPQAKELSRRPHVVIATPGRLRALLEMDADLARAFARVRFLVLDEADRLLEPTFESELAVVLGVRKRGVAVGAGVGRGRVGGTPRGAAGRGGVGWGWSGHT